jgi:uncharacterized protein with PQ loop repeat
MVSPALTAFMTVLSLFSNSLIYVEVYKVWARQSHDDISFTKTLFGVISSSAWMYYGRAIGSIPLLVSSVTAFIGLLMMMLLKLTIPNKSASQWTYV